ncbi:MAG: peptidase T [Ruminococcaceae bacterium]|nr:peptidase T [Oscillospiraceae bacterium]
MRSYERFLKYITYSTASSETSGVTPSTDGQLVLAKALNDELLSMGIESTYNDLGYVYAVIPATKGCENVPAIGFIAHMDTSPEFSGEGVKAQLIENYDGTDVILGESGRILKVSDFPHLTSLKGQTLITTDGTTLLGGDDKAGIAEIITMAEILLKNNLPHGKICIGFTPDEEIGEGADHFEVPLFGADFGYTVDGGGVGGVEYENFNASGATVKIKGFSVHPGSSKNTMINASLVAMEFNSMLPACDTPRNTEGYQGFFHLTDMKGETSEATLSYIVRDHDAHNFEIRNETLRHITALLNEKYGEGTVTLEIKEQYRNMAEMVRPHYHIVETAIKAAENVGVTPEVYPIRGGTDGARLSFMGLPCPNLGTGAYAGHGPYEHATVEGMDKCVEILLEIVRIYTEK